jgi:hypothetical protein
VYAGLLWTGYQRRKGIWTRRSWILFGGSLLLTFVLVGIALSMASGVDNGIYAGMSRRARTAYFYTMFALLLGGILPGAILILSFARGDQHRQFGFRPTRHGPGPETMQQTELRDRLHDALVTRGFAMVAERANSESYGGWQRDYVRGGRRAQLTWNSERWCFTLEDGQSLGRVATKRPPELVGKGLAEFIALVDAS